MKKTLAFIKTILSKCNLIANLALHHQLIVLNRSIKRSQIKTKDRLFWIFLYLFWNNWQESLIVLKPETVVGWHKKGFRLFWKWKSRSKSPAHPRINHEIRNLSLLTVARSLNYLVLDGCIIAINGKKQLK